MPTLYLPLLYLCAATFLFLEHRYPAYPLQGTWRWYLRASLVNISQLVIFIAIDAIWTHYIGSWSLFTLDHSLPAVIGALVAYFIFTFVVYWWHRLRHRSNFIWRWFHQFHHSPQRIQTLTAYYIHPLDMLVNLLISNSIVYLLLGLDLPAAACYTLITGIAGFLIHANLRVPRQIGYVFQTPQMHRLHHQSEHHAHNYSDIVWWDMLFGTYCNPRRSIDRCGFDQACEEKWLAMLLGRDLFVKKIGK